MTSSLWRRPATSRVARSHGPLGASPGRGTRGCAGPCEHAALGGDSCALVHLPSRLAAGSGGAHGSRADHLGLGRACALPNDAARAPGAVRHEPCPATGLERTLDERLCVRARRERPADPAGRPRYELAHATPGSPLPTLGLQRRFRSRAASCDAALLRRQSAGHEHEGFNAARSGRSSRRCCSAA